MKYRITHTTSYAYGELVPVCHNEVYLTPRDDDRQSCRFHRLSVKPAPASTESRHDYFGNLAHHLSIQQPHRRLSVTATSRVEIRPRALPPAAETPPWESVRDRAAADTTPAGIADAQFLFDSPCALRGYGVADYAAPSFPAGRPILEALLDLTARVNADFQYVPGATAIHTRVDEVLALRRGVCQDFAHLQIAALRSIGLPARYVSGYLRTIPPPGQPRIPGIDASHAWVSAYCGELGWIDFDPTNNLVTNTDHITVAWGRDYADVCPIKGVFIGGGAHELTVSVDVEPLDDVPISPSAPDDSTPPLSKGGPGGV